MSTDVSSTKSSTTKVESTKITSSESKYQEQEDSTRDGFTHVDFTSPYIAEELRARIPPLPTTRSGRSEWMRLIARDATLSIAQVRSLGADVSALGVRFDSLLTGASDAAVLERSKTGEIVCRDRSTPGTYFVYTTLPELLASKVAGRGTKLKRHHHVEWRIRLLTEADLIDLPLVELRPLPAGMRPHVEMVYKGLRLLFGCRWFLEPGEPIPFSAAFIEGWCGVTSFHARDARDVLRTHVIKEAGAIPSGRPSPTTLFLPLEVQ